ncbi:outer membrane protein TolC [Rhodobacter aestuarii]|uniref:Outer membrane protein TolC n=1 Tax=Rhodobacter aestuarii TaxID=453582 RepID=A0A1N7IXD5_9RHOB|nr:TolC family protein [Rhodobacter aestuarii]PTV97440.1 outer membrane protein TolC [Rhodobacter aestuarii]SIS41657.1 Outer membrane protein TolC [Rhodobacter aestuarii]
MHSAIRLMTGALVLAACAPQTDGLQLMQSEIDMRLAAGIAEPAPTTALSGKVAQDFTTALRNALLADPGYRAARASEAQAEAQIAVAQSGRRPQLTGSAMAGRIEEHGGTTPDKTTGASGDLTLTQLLYDGGASTAQVDRSTAEALVARAERRVQENAVLLEAARAWIDWQSAASRLAALDRRAAQMDEMIGQIERLASAGTFDRSALDTARGKALDVKLMRRDLAAELADARIRFEQRFGAAPARLGAAQLPSQKLRQAQREDAWRQAPILQRAAAALIAARAGVAAAQAGFRPEVSVQVGATTPMQSDDSSDVMAGVRLRYTFHDGGRRKAQLEASTQTVAAREAALADAQRSARAEHRAAVAQLQTLHSTTGLLAQKATLLAEHARTARSQIATGQSDLGALIATEVEAYQTEERKITTQAALMLAQIEIAAGTGDLAQIVGVDAP